MQRAGILMKQQKWLFVFHTGRSNFNHIIRMTVSQARTKRLRKLTFRDMAFSCTHEMPLAEGGTSSKSGRGVRASGRVPAHAQVAAPDLSPPIPGYRCLAPCSYRPRLGLETYLATNIPYGIGDFLFRVSSLFILDCAETLE